MRHGTERQKCRDRTKRQKYKKAERHSERSNKDSEKKRQNDRERERHKDRATGIFETANYVIRNLWKIGAHLMVA